MKCINFVFRFTEKMLKAKNELVIQLAFAVSFFVASSNSRHLEREIISILHNLLKFHKLKSFPTFTVVLHMMKNRSKFALENDFVLKCIIS